MYIMEGIEILKKSFTKNPFQQKEEHYIFNLKKIEKKFFITHQNWGYKTKCARRV